jgi:predicted ATPase
MSIDAGGSELDGQRYPVKLPADVDDDRHIDISNLEFAKNACGALYEQLNGRELECLGSTETGQYGRALQRLHVMEALSFYVERLAAGRQYLHARSSPQHLQGLTMDAAAAVATDRNYTKSEAVDRVVVALVAKSLVAVDADGSGTRLRLLATTRAYTLENLGESGELDVIARRQAEAPQHSLRAAA